MNQQEFSSWWRSARLPGTEPNPFEGWTENHVYYAAVFAWFLDRLALLSEPAILVFVGPAGAGKSTLIYHICVELSRRLKAMMEADPSKVPYCRAELSFHPTVGVDWRGAFDDILEGVDEILIDRKVEADGRRPGSLPGLNRAVRQMLRNRKPAVAIFDEGGCLVNARSPEATAKNLNYLKALCNRGRTHLALFGDYSLTQLSTASQQIRRRTHFVHLPAYPADNVALFRTSVVAPFELRMRTKGIDTELVSSSDLLLEGSVGCVGAMHKWLVNAIGEAKLQKKPVTRSILEATAPSASEVAASRQEIKSGLMAVENACAKFKVFDPRQ